MTGVSYTVHRLSITEERKETVFDLVLIVVIPTALGYMADSWLVGVGALIVILALYAKKAP